jgi:hypothetical protein
LNADDRRESGEVFDERRHDDFVHESGEVCEYPDHSVPLDEIGGTLAEGYAEGRRSLHAHFRVGSEGHGEFRDYCAIIERLCDDRACIDGAEVREDGDLVRREHESSYQRRAIQSRRHLSPPRLSAPTLT